MQDRHLDGTVLVDLPRPTILITDGYTALDKPAEGGRKAREGALLERVRHAVEQGGNVLLPVDSTGRVFELLIVLDECWEKNNLSHLTLAMLMPVCRSTLELATTFTEWLSKHVNQRFVQNRQNVFSLPHVHRCWLKLAQKKMSAKTNSAEKNRAPPLPLQPYCAHRPHNFFFLALDVLCVCLCLAAP